jgi:hypothetical protein
MDDYIPIIEDEPAFARLSLHTAFFLVILLCGFQYTFGKCVEHTVTGAIAENKVISKGCDVFDVEQQDVFALFVLQGFDDFLGKF